MVNKEKLLLLATIHMLVPGALPGWALADNAVGEKLTSKKLPATHNLHRKHGLDTSNNNAVRSR